MIEEPDLTNLRCRSCHYSLRGLQLTSNCPECGFTIADSFEWANRVPSPFPAHLFNFIFIIAIPILNFGLAIHSSIYGGEFEMLVRFVAFWGLLAIAGLIVALGTWVHHHRRASVTVFYISINSAILAFVNFVLLVAAN